jgi:hypothetical protein
LRALPSGTSSVEHSPMSVDESAIAVSSQIACLN